MPKEFPGYVPYQLQIGVIHEGPARSKPPVWDIKPADPFNTSFVEAATFQEETDEDRIIGQVLMESRGDVRAFFILLSDFSEIRQLAMQGIFDVDIYIETLNRIFEQLIILRSSGVPEWVVSQLNCLFLAEKEALDKLEK
ncbi:MAG: hypothetical protein M3Q81_02515 [bacterium]|nr:hypothetical protein [bacterium]